MRYDIEDDGDTDRAGHGVGWHADDEPLFQGDQGMTTETILLLLSLFLLGDTHKPTPSPHIRFEYI